jgi:signal transduction histidine kinase
MPANSRHERPNHLYRISEIIIQSGDWKKSLDDIMQIIRSVLIFDNLAVYLLKPDHNLDVFYARAMGRGKKAEADSAWGETLANQVIEGLNTISQKPIKDLQVDRLNQPYLLGIPLCINRHILGALILVRFGGPPFRSANIQLAEFIAQQISLLIERQNLQREYQIILDRNKQIQLQEDFISTISHELRNPLGFIKGYTTTLLRKDINWDSKTQRDFLEIIDKETDQLQGLMDNLLDSARLQTGMMEMRFQSISLEELANEVITRCRQRTPQLQTQLKSKDNLRPINADKYRLAQVFENILTNAIKYAPGSDICITIEQDEQDTEITIQDFGPGIPERYLPYIFDRFFRNPEQSPNIHGSGLGLFICEQIIHAHNGSIGAKSGEGKGTTFIIKIPITSSLIQP